MLPCIYTHLHTHSRTLPDTITLSSGPMLQGKGQRSNSNSTATWHLSEVHTCFIHAWYVIPVRSIASCLLGTSRKEAAPLLLSPPLPPNAEKPTTRLLLPSIARSSFLNGNSATIRPTAFAPFYMLCSTQPKVSSSPSSKIRGSTQCGPCQCM
ncbi:hypothetical protein CCMA1212_002898 [Trichoderma ghanense]|uniref:Uncharacterized protein n=1 Tax=Trichoderma ghanense TaxID=65468 RepID=A0ABY2HCG9_9HYPO